MALLWLFVAMWLAIVHECDMAILMLMASATVPALLLFWYFWAKDRNPEPRGLLLKHFFGGIVICLPVILVAGPLQSLGAAADGMWGKAFTKGVLGAAIPEEGFKTLVLLAFAWPSKDFDERIDGMIYGVTASLGFATLENVLYVSSGGMGVAVLRSVTAVPCHAFLGAIMGAFLTRAKFGPKEHVPVTLLLGYLVPMALHGTYDMVLFTESGFALLAVPILFFMGRWARNEVLAAHGHQAQVMAQTASAVVVTQGPVETTVTTVTEQRVVLAPAPLEPSRSIGGWLKLFVGGLGLTACSLMYVGLAALIGEPKQDIGGLAIVAVLFAIPTALCFLLFRSGLRIPSTA